MTTAFHADVIEACEGTHMAKLSAKVRCSAKGCRLHINELAFQQEWPEADAWAQVACVGADRTLYLCPLHRAELEEHGEVTKQNHQKMTQKENAR